LLQSSIEYCSRQEPLEGDLIVYRGFPEHGSVIGPLYESMVGEMIILREFVSTSTELEVVKSHFMNGTDPILFEISLHPGDAAVAIRRYSAHPDEFEVLIAASTGFIVEAVDQISTQDGLSSGMSCVNVPRVKLSCFIPWHDFNTDDAPGIGII
jgi:hypothetical protein